MSPALSSFLTKLILAAVLFPTSTFSKTYPGWWINYNSCAWPSLDAAVPSACSNDVGLTATQCLCNSATFLSAAAKGIGAQCGCSILENSAATAVNICQSLGLAIALGQSQIVAAGQPCSSVTSGSTSTSSPTSSLTSSLISSQTTALTAGSTPTPSSSGGGNETGKGDSGGLSPALTAVVTVMGLLVAILGLCIQWRYRKNRRARNSTEAANLLQRLP